MLLFLTTFLAGVHVFGIGAASCLYSLRGPEQLLDLAITCSEEGHTGYGVRRIFHRIAVHDTLKALPHAGSSAC